MYKQERIEQVLQILRSQHFCTVEQLVEKLHYSPATIRRDLTQLAKMGMIEKCYGGASFIGKGTFAEREHRHTVEKSRLCLAAGEMIRDGDTVFVDGTTTTYFLRDVLIKKQHLFVVTTNLKLAIDLCEHGVTCYLPGGKLCDTTMLGGPITAEELERYTFDIAFISPGKVSHGGSFGMPEVFSASTRAVLKNAKKSVCLYHKDKLLPNVQYTFGRLGDFHAVVSDAPFPTEFATEFSDTQFILVK